MVEQGFLAPRPIRPGTIGLVILGHVALLGAVIVAKGPPMMLRPPVIQTYRVIDPPPPPPNPVPPPPSKAPPDRLDTPTRIVEATLPTEVKLVNLPRLDPTPPTRTIDPPLPPPPPPRAPVTTEAAPDARYAGGFQPAYPPTLQRAEIEGRATVRVLVGADGRVHAVEIVSADDPAFAQATRRQALKAWRFRPATRDGVAVESWRTMTVHFRMQA